MHVTTEAAGEREKFDYDVVIVGAGPAGLATAIRIRQLMPEASVVVLEKGSEPGAHTLSGAVMDPRAIDELLPGWKALGAPLNQPVTADEFFFLGGKRSLRTPGWLVPRCFRNEGNYAISLGRVVKWLAEHAQAQGVEIFAGFAATEVLYDPQGRVIGVGTGDMGVTRSGDHGPAYQRGVELHGKYTIFAEGARGQLGRQLIERFDLARDRDPVSYAIGLKESWEVDATRARPGLVVHTAGWPMQSDTFGGGFIYHLEGNRVSLGFVVGLDYGNPWLSPYEEFQRWKTHPAVRAHIEGGRRLGYGARAINNGFPRSLPRTVFPGGALVGCEAGYLNAARIKGSHAAIKTGMLAAEAVCDALRAGRSGDELVAYPQAFAKSWLHAELQESKNFKLWFKYGSLVGTLMTGIEQWLMPRLGIRTPPWTLRNRRPDHESLRPAAKSEPIHYPKPDGKLSFDRMSSVYLSNTHHEEDQPVHLRLRDRRVPVETNLRLYAGPESRYCPAGVYEFLTTDRDEDRLQINAQNCIHCKTCDIKDPTQNIVWVAPQGGEGPDYDAM
ncbi:electron transfer flavoprotein-ubiquinone oxidoreductase [Variovorax sp. OV329]|uniref:electron transfer flavoprotein-ubiquinone oxidoreductase n=1 Tax=Variovorax sp. OV329 TaxID=1882825 RepID=UPI0008E85C66|nr:electron transfer flavoprotein-ubiquinone oxidoreductase [Variovorax sp. OV329]SFM68903.1 electron-transferring-flavoprotein dehydrogenase [Variovorax sp. OV329]